MTAGVGKRPDCVVKISGGLGNQLFQYAAARAMALRTDSKLVLDASFFRPGRHRQFELDQFPIEAQVIRAGDGRFSLRRCVQSIRSVLRRGQQYREPHFHFDPGLLRVVPPVTLTGYFQSYRYFEDSAEQIRRELAVPRPTDAETLRMIGSLAKSDFAVMHIRRTDYVSNAKNSQIYAQCDVNYYQRAMEQLPPETPVLVLSDDLPWARANLPETRRLYFPESSGGRPGLADLWLMTQARHHIIANSSFSWWGAWLSAAEGGVKIAPARWFVDSSLLDRDLVPASWTRL